MSISGSYLILDIKFLHVTKIFGIRPLVNGGSTKYKIKLSNPQDIVILSHRNPDGDA